MYLKYILRGDWVCQDASEIRYSVNDVRPRRPLRCAVLIKPSLTQPKVVALEAVKYALFANSDPDNFRRVALAGRAAEWKAALGTMSDSIGSVYGAHSKNYSVSFVVVTVVAIANAAPTTHHRTLPRPTTWSRPRSQFFPSCGSSSTRPTSGPSCGCC